MATLIQTKITQIDNKSAETAWSPVPQYADVIALGAKDSGGSGFDETGAELELYDLKLSDKDTPPILLGSIKTTSRFASLAWATSRQFPMGLVAGGMEDGSVHVWDPRAIVQQQQDQLVASYARQLKGPIKALQFNPHRPQELAIGASDGTVAIVNLDQPQAPITPAHSSQSAQITSVAWNTQVSHILASSAADGTVAVWDCKGQKLWCELRDPLAISDIVWNPTQGLHLLTASGDDRNPLIKLWDLRASTSMPLATLTGHTQGILSMAWCPHDDHLLLSCGKDNQTLLWDLYTLKPIAAIPNDVPTTSGDPNGETTFAGAGLASNSQRRFQVQWSPIKRGVVSTASLDHKVQAHSILGLSSKAGRPPKWMRPSSSVSCGFGGSVVSCGATDKIVRLRTVQELPSLAQRSQDFEATLEGTTVVDYCNTRASQAPTTGETQLWSFMQTIFESNARQQLLDILGYDPAKIAEQAAAYREDEAAVTEKVEHLSLKDMNTTVMSKSAEDMVKKALMVGNFEAAVECCFNTGNLADALILASVGGADLWTKTQERYFQSQSAERKYLTTVSAVIHNELEGMVEKSDPAMWTETLAILSTYGKSDEFPALCIRLGDLLESFGDKRSASLCYMCALSLDKAVVYWRGQLENANQKNGGMDYAALHEFVIKVSIFLEAVGPAAQLVSEDAELFSVYASKLAEQGLLVTAAKYGKGDSLDSKILKDRLYRSKASPSCLAAMGNVAPEFPFSMSDVRKSRQRAVQQQQTQEQSYGQQQVSQNGYGQQNGVAAQTGTHTQQAPGALLAGWIELQDPSSGRMYYANQTTGEVTWDRPQPTQVPVQAPAAQPGYSVMTPGSSMAQLITQQSEHSTSADNQPTVSSAPSTRTSKLASKYGDGFVTSASHPELASQYGNIGTSNPYHGTARPGTAQVGNSSTVEKPPVSADLDLDKIQSELKDEFLPIKDCLPSLVDALKNTQLTGTEQKLCSESEKGVTILLKRLTRGQVSDEIGHKVVTMCGYINSYDFRSAQSICTDLVSHEWKFHKDWLKGLKGLLQLASKKFAQ